MNEEEIKLYNDLFKQIKEGMNWSDQKTDLWFQTRNTLLGEQTPLEMLQSSRGYKLKKFVNTTLEENKNV